MLRVGRLITWPFSKARHEVARLSLHDTHTCGHGSPVGETRPHGKLRVPTERRPDGGLHGGSMLSLGRLLIPHGAGHGFMTDPSCYQSECCSC